jgi:hypothetical protein
MASEATQPDPNQPDPNRPNDTPDLEDALRSIEATGEDTIGDENERSK